MRNRAPWWATALLVSLCWSQQSAYAMDAASALERARATVSAVQRKLPAVELAAKAAVPKTQSIARRVAAGELHLRNRNYADAIHVLCQVLELHRQGKANEDAAADAEMLLAETYFQDSQLLAARRHYVHVLESSEKRAYAPYAGVALGRLVDVSLRTENPAILEAAMGYMDRLPGTDEGGAIEYARGKALYATGKFEEARAALSKVPSDSKYLHQSSYLVGVALMKIADSVPQESDTDQGPPSATTAEGGPKPPETGGRYSAAVEQFRLTAKLPADSPEQQEVVDLAWMAIGRLHYEVHEFDAAAEAYSQVRRESREFPMMLYELAWVYARNSEFQRAQRSLEVLSILHPESLELADGPLLRADLMLRAGQFENALGLYRSVRRRFEPIRSELMDFLKANTDPAVYYDELITEGLGEVQGSNEISPVVLQWAREQAQNERAFAVIDDVSRSQILVRNSRRIIVQLRAILGSVTRVKAFSEIQAPYEHAVALVNQLASAQGALMLGLAGEASEDAPGKLGAFSREQSEWSGRLERLPKTPGDFARRASQGQTQWNRLSQQLQRLTLEVDRLQAITNALKKVVSDSERFGVKMSQPAQVHFRAQIAANERDLFVYRSRIAAFRQYVDLGRVQVGFGDKRFVEDARTRSAFLKLTVEAFKLATKGKAGADASGYAKEATPTLSKIVNLNRQLGGVLSQLESQAAARAEDVGRQVAVESEHIEQFAGTLDELDQQARLLVGELAMQNFVRVQERLKSIVLRADVGIVQQAWELREAQRSRVRSLQRERAREEQNLNQELQEVLQDEEDTL